MNARLPTHNPEMTATPAGRDTMVRTLRTLLRDSMTLRNEGVSYAKLAHAQGYADGYMRLMVDSGVVSSRELLEIVRDVRRGVDGPETRRLTHDDLAVSA